MSGALFWFFILILYTYLIYPLLLALGSRWSRLQRTGSRKASTLPGPTPPVPSKVKEPVAAAEPANGDTRIHTLASNTQR